MPSHDLNFHGWEETNLKNWDEILLMNYVETYSGMNYNG
jgi:hypothetical protein